MGLTNGPVLVTGADGFIGSHLTELLVKQGCQVRAFVYYNAFGGAGWLDQLKPDIRSQLHLVYGDIRDGAAVKQAMKGCHTVFHLAALVGIPYSYLAPESYIDTNIKGTLHVLQAARELGVERIVHTSTSEVYGTARYVPMTEEHPLLGQSPYSASKIGADQLALSFYYAYGLPVVILRPFNTYGPRQSRRAVLPTIITQLLAGADSIRLGSVLPTRDFTYVQDTVRGFTAAAQAVGAIGHTVHIGSGRETSIGEAAALVAELLGVEAAIESDTARVRPAGSEVERLWADPSKAKQLLGWEPKYGGADGLRRGLAETIEWFASMPSAWQAEPQSYTI